MTDPVHKALRGAVYGVLGGAIVDLHAYLTGSDTKFDWKLAMKRWLAGGIAGIAGELGLPIIGA